MAENNIAETKTMKTLQVLAINQRQMGKIRNKEIVFSEHFRTCFGFICFAKLLHLHHRWTQGEGIRAHL